MSALADQLEGVILERGSLPACELAMSVRRRKEDVLKALHCDPRFVQTGKRKASRWNVVPRRSFDASVAAERWNCSLDVASELLFGSEGFVARGFVASVNGNGSVRVTERGLAIAYAVGSLRPESAS